MSKNQGKPCETCINEEKTGGMYPCAVCHGSDKWVAKKVVEGEDTPVMTVSRAEGTIKTNEILGELPFKEAPEEAYIYHGVPLLPPVFFSKIVNLGEEEPAK